MTLESARELKESLKSSALLAATVTAQSMRARRAATADVNLDAVSAQPLDSVPDVTRTMAIGIAKKSKSDFRIAVRLQRQSLIQSPLVEQVRQRARGEVDVRFVGRITKRAKKKLWYRHRVRPLEIGVSIGHYRITAGTLGCFVESKSREPFILSNNHVLANEDDARKGDDILQPGKLDGGRSSDLVGALGNWIVMKRRGNVVDAALAEIYDTIEFLPGELRAFPAKKRRLLGMAAMSTLDIGDPVAKTGRTTGCTEGRITAFELDNVVVSYDRGNLSFDDQIEIEGRGKKPFSDGGDSGSLIVDADNLGMALLFAGSDSGGTNGRGLTYANVLETVLQKLKVNLIV